MTSSLKEQFARLGPVKGIDLVGGGSPAVISTRELPARQILKPISAVIALVRRGVLVLRAKRAVEEVLDRGCVPYLSRTSKTPQRLPAKLPAPVSSPN